MTEFDNEDSSSSDARVRTPVAETGKTPLAETRRIGKVHNRLFPFFARRNDRLLAVKKMPLPTAGREFTQGCRCRCRRRETSGDFELVVVSMPGASRKFVTDEGGGGRGGAEPQHAADTQSTHCDVHTLYHISRQVRGSGSRGLLIVKRPYVKTRQPTVCVDRQQLTTSRRQRCRESRVAVGFSV